MKAVVLAGGLGTRMLPLTKTTPKSLLIVNNRPFLWFIIENLRKAGISDIFIIYGFKREKFKEFLENFNVKATLVHQKQPLGTGDAVKLMNKFTRNESFIVLAGDQLFSAADIRSIANSEYHNCLSAFYVNDPKKYGMIKIKDGKLVKIIEKPKKDYPAFINASLYKFSHNIYKYLNLVKLSKRNEYELTDAVSLMAKDIPVYVKKLNDYWLDLGCLKDRVIIEKRLKELGY